VHFRVWAPKCQTVSVQLSNEVSFPAPSLREVALEAEPDGYFSGLLPDAGAGMFYKFKLPTGSFPDPASRFQPQGPHGASEIVDALHFPWTDGSWRGVRRQGQVVYELHIGTFTAEGNWAAAREQLPELARLGITLIEVMPVADFPGRFGWGYDGVNLFAPTRLYGRPDDFRAFVDRAHSLGLGVILDVVYNHFGPDGNYLNQFSPSFASQRHHSEWGEAINFDSEHSGPVREFFLANAAYWIGEFHLDGLRLDATQQIWDDSPQHILAEISRHARAAAAGRDVFLVAENERQQANLARRFESGGYGLGAIWNDDFHHSALVALTGHNEAYYSDYQGTPQELISAVKHGFLFQGQWFRWQKKCRGTPAWDLAPEQFVNFLENHDQVSNSLHGRRLYQSADPGQIRALTALLLLSPATPMLFQGQEFGATAPFLYFADHEGKLARDVAAGRNQFLRQFPSFASLQSNEPPDPPDAVQTFHKCKLDFSERQKHAPIFALHQDLLRLRREDPVFSRPQAGRLDGVVLGPASWVLRFFGPENDDRLLLVNLGVDQRLQSLAEPLVAPVEGHGWKIHWSSEDPRYGGSGTPPLGEWGNWLLPGHSALVLAPAAEEGRGALQ